MAVSESASSKQGLSADAGSSVTSSGVWVASGKQGLPADASGGVSGDVEAGGERRPPTEADGSFSGGQSQGEHVPPHAPAMHCL